MNVKSKIPVLVTTEHRGVFFGYMNPEDKNKTTVELEKIRNCIYWSRDVGGFLGLAQTGPTADCRIGTEAPVATLHGITSITVCTDKAVKAWTSA